MSRIAGCRSTALILLCVSSLVPAETTAQISQTPVSTKSTVDPLERPLALEQPGAAPKSDPLHSRSSNAGLAMSTIVGGLAICLGIFLIIVVLTRRNSSHKFGPLPTEVVESLGRMTLNHRQQLQLIRLGRKLILLNVTTQGASAVAEIDDPDEVTRLAGLCQQDRPNSVTTTFREVLGKYGQESNRGDHDDQRLTIAPDSRGSLVHTRRPTRDGYHG